MKRLKQNMHLITSFRKLNKAQQKQIGKNIDSEQLKFVCECCMNILNKNIPLGDDLKQHLFKHREKIRTLANRKCTLKRKKKLIQTGGFLGALFTALGSAAVSYVFDKYLKNNNG
jgi:hypothetical protein